MIHQRRTLLALTLALAATGAIAHPIELHIEQGSGGREALSGFGFARRSLRRAAPVLKVARVKP